MCDMLISNAVSKSAESSTFCPLMPLSVTSVGRSHAVQVLQTLQVFSDCSVLLDIKCCIWGFERSLASDKYFFPAFFLRQLICAVNGVCCLKQEQLWKFLHLLKVFWGVSAFGVEHGGCVRKLQQWAPSSHVLPSCACAQCDLMEFISKSYQKLINPTVLKTEEMLHFVLIYFYVLSIPNISFSP